MSEQQEEYNYVGKEKARRKQLDRQLIAQLAAEPEQFMELLEEDQACAILQAIMTKYPKVLQKVPKNIPKCAE